MHKQLCRNTHLCTLLNRNIHAMCVCVCAQTGGGRPGPGAGLRGYGGAGGLLVVRWVQASVPARGYEDMLEAERGACWWSAGCKLLYRDMHAMCAAQEAAGLGPARGYEDMLEAERGACWWSAGCKLLYRDMHAMCAAQEAAGLGPALCYENVLEAERGGLPGFRWTRVREDDGCGLCYTSGTTGRPKVTPPAGRPPKLLHHWRLAVRRGAVRWGHETHRLLLHAGQIFWGAACGHFSSDWRSAHESFLKLPQSG